MKILLLGSTGRTGRWVLDQLLSEGYFIHTIVRPGSRMHLHSDKINVFKGSPNSKDLLSQAMQGCDALINVLNISRKTDFPWSRLRTPPKFLSEIMQLIVNMAPQMGLKRILLCSAWGVRESIDEIPFWFKIVIQSSNIRYPYLDHGRQEEILEKSQLDWTIVRPVGLTNQSGLREIQISEGGEPKPNLTISRKMVARFLVEAIQDKDLIHRIVTISQT